MKRYLLDTNVLLRFLLADHPEHSPMAVHLFQQAADGKCLLILTDLAIAEAVWVLASFYKIQRQEIADSLSKIAAKAGIHCPSLDLTLDALNRFKTTNCDFFDCYLAAQAIKSGAGVASFDRDLMKFKDVKLWAYKSQHEKS